MVDHLDIIGRRRNMAAIRSKNTVPELSIRRILHRLGFRYRLHVSKLPGQPDLVFRKREKIIFVHGCFWHRHTNCKNATIPKTNIEFWKERFKKNTLRDRSVKAQLIDSGWKIHTVWECELRNIEALTDNLVNFLEKD